MVIDLATAVFRHITDREVVQGRKFVAYVGDGLLHLGYRVRRAPRP